MYSPHLDIVWFILCGVNHTSVERGYAPRLDFFPIYVITNISVILNVVFLLLQQNTKVSSWLTT